MIIEDYYQYILQGRKHRKHGILPKGLYEEKVEELRKGDI